MTMPPLQVNAAVALLGLSLVSWPAIARADSTEAFCQLSRHDHTIPVESAPCLFSQRQGNVTVQMGKRCPAGAACSGGAASCRRARPQSPPRSPAPGEPD